MPLMKNAEMTEPVNNPKKDTFAPAPDLDTWLRVVSNPTLIDEHTLTQVVDFAYRYLQTIQDRANVLCEELMLPGTHALTFDVWSLHPRNPITHQPYLVPVIPRRSVIRLEEADRG
ncbi:hypothetical protein LTR12_011136 [Friedmanniomyces endolithicus]|nr:hypothetical protein LTR74_017106 [Friedmanniomyces endolithicus]KAK1814495.1 hypothetical protein LTR12_011136 [Friedmanniomyces endolithicus]